MLSGNGRHRRPRQAPALFVAAGVTGAGIALPLLGATGAHAADAGTWDRVADCESGGAWSANDANGYYGGLQLDLDTWKYYGGTMYAERPDLASRSEQIAIGEKILEAEGPHAFPHCGSGLQVPGLGQGSDATPDQKPSQSPSESPSASPSQETGEPEQSARPDDSGKPSGTGKPDKPGKSDEPSKPGKGSPDTEPTPGAKPGDSAGEQPSDEASDTPGDGSSTSPRPPSGGGGPDSGPAEDDDSGSDSSSWSNLGPSSPDRLKSPSDESDESAETDPSEESGKPGKGKHRGSPADDDRASRGGDREGGGKHRVTVRTGDSLSRIAAQHEVAGGWAELYERNRETIGDDPDLIRPGQHLTL
ncbi:transglycosylase family protein [Streptomyces sp. 891-h]|uniref:LysM peptidoglycan-binding domain-containing protein n=1 Tax=unclassified Streptomyces TaxID=2593676 RepID=UPI001FAAF082|nr:transglycosylase family protein [Streptomyces sp. 891-h]UNZ18965.1 LysM peptidoglycan-binding domain-containing protein [Streptomyces sp. 891-h]